MTKTTVEEFYLHEKVMSGRRETSKMQTHEVESIFAFVNALVNCGLEIKSLEGFYVDYQIPHISKQFDLLKITKESILNIELKSSLIDEEKIERQLKQNKYYIEATKRSGHFYTVLTDSMKVYRLINEEMVESNVKELSDCLVKINKEDLEFTIEGIFNPRNYLISPINSPERFANGEYFLTNQQSEIKKSIMLLYEKTGRRVAAITGKAGTGKTLLLFDLAKEISKRNKVLVLHCAKLASGHLWLEKITTNIKIAQIKDVRELLDFYDVVMIDEAQRLYSNLFNEIVQHITKKKKFCLFFYDSEQTMSIGEGDTDCSKQIEGLYDIQCFSLSDKIRTNHELSLIIPSIFNLNKKVSIEDINNFEVVYTDTVLEANRLIAYYKSLNYTFINFSKSNYNHSDYSYFYGENYDSHHVIGQEFDNVVIVLGKEFAYMPSGELKAKEHPNPNYLYLKLLFQALTRARFKIAIVICDNFDLYQKMINIL